VPTAACRTGKVLERGTPVIAPSTRLGPYEIVARIGAGGMGEVWRARDTRIGRDVAIKILPPEFTSSADRLHRFEQEARAAGGLNHPNLVTIHDLGTDSGVPYIVMELLEGETLRERIGTDGTPGIPVRKAMDMAVQIANGLAAAHERGIVHRDLKPENIFITPDGGVKILDFSLAKLTAVEDPSDDSRTRERETSPGTVLGTVGYMSPEQVRGQDVDHRTDVFAFGAILYEMLSGRRAFRRDSSVETMNAILNEDPPELSPSASHSAPAVCRIVLRCLEKSRGERFQSARDLAFALDAVSGGTSQSAVTTAPAAAQPASRRRNILMALLH
jgi:serine/threonine protein kinase